MQNTQKGSTFPIVIILLVVLIAIVGYVAFKVTVPPVIDTVVLNEEIVPSASVSPAASAPSVSWKTYVNSQVGYEVNYPANWIIETTDGGSTRIVNPLRQGKVDTDEPIEAITISLRLNTLPCEASAWAVGFAGNNYRTACVVGNTKITVLMSAFDEQSKLLEDMMLRSLTITVKPVTTAAASITITSPGGATTWKIGQTYSVTYSTRKDYGPVTIALVKYSDDGVILNSTIIGTSSTGTFTYKVPTNTEVTRGLAGRYKIEVYPAGARELVVRSNDFITIIN